MRFITWHVARRAGIPKALNKDHEADALTPMHYKG
jgi:hypothetical protein